MEIGDGHDFPAAAAAKLANAWTAPSGEPPEGQT